MPPSKAAILSGGPLGEAFGFARAFLRFARWRAAGAALLIFVGALFEGVSLLMLVPILAVVTGGRTALGGSLIGPLAAALRGHDQVTQLLLLLGLFALLMLVRGIVLGTRDRAIARLQLEFIDSIRSRLVTAMAGAGWQGISRINHSRMVQALGFDIHQTGVAANAGLLATVSAAMLAGQCALALILAPLTGALAIVLVLIAVLAGRRFLKRARSLGRTINEANLHLTHEATRFLDGLKPAIAQGLQQDFVRMHMAASHRQMRDRLLFMLQQADLRNVTVMFAALAGAVALIVGIAIVHLAPAVLLTLLLVLSRMNAPTLVVQQGLQNMLHSLPAYATIVALEAELIGTASPETRLSEPRTVTGGEGIGFRRVSFRHPGQQESAAGLESVSLTIPPGAFVGIVGPSGAGKTTFLDLVAGLIAPQEGVIDVHGLGSDRIAYVAQDPLIFDDTIRRNLAWSRSEATEVDMLAAIEMVGAGDLLRRLANGLDSRIGARGALISAGERQRLALARAILRRPALFILDEATNAIDIAGEAALLAALVTLTPSTTILMVAHRRESLRLCDHILTFPGPVLARVGPAEPVALAG